MIPLAPLRRFDAPAATDLPLGTRRARRLAAVLALLALLCLSLPGLAHADPGDIGVEGLSHSGTGTPTGTKRAESILWFNDGLWWANMWDVATSDFYIFKLDTATQTWTKTPTKVDTRSNTHADVLWTGTKLYIASHTFVNDTVAAQPGFPSYLYRYSYNATTKQYSLDAGFPTQINNYKTETLVIDRDSTGKLWAIWQQDNKIFLNRTTGPDDVWGTPYQMPGSTDVTIDDNGSLVRLGNRILAMWGDQSTGTDGMYFSIHADGAPDTAWSTKQAAISGPGSADDHMNLKWLDESGGKVYAAVKTSFTQASQPLILLLVFNTATGTWSSYPIALVSDCPNRVIVLIDQESRQLHTYATYPKAPDFSCNSTGGSINEKTTSLDAISFPTGRGTPRILDADSIVHNVSSTKQNVTPQSGVAIVADNNGTSRYWTSFQSLGGQPPAAPDAAFTTNPTGGVAPLNVTFTDTSTGGPTSWAWNFGDGATATTQNPTHTYTAPGTYNVSLVATNATGSDTATGSITVTQSAPANIVRQSVSTVVNNTATTSVAINRPAGTVAGDVLVSCIATNGASVNAGGVPAGWTTLASVTGAGNPRVFGYLKVATASEPASYSWGLSASAANSGGIARYSGSSGLDASATQATAPSGTSLTVPDVTTTVANAMLVGCAAANSSSMSLTIGSPPGMTDAWDITGKRQQLADGTQATAGSSGNKTWTLNSSRASAGFLAALRPS
jgi:PKD repeat protein